MKTIKDSKLLRLIVPFFVLAVLLLDFNSYAGFNQYSIGLNFGSTDANNGTGARALASTDVAGLPAGAPPNSNNMPRVTRTTNRPVVPNNKTPPPPLRSPCTHTPPATP